MNQRIRLWTTLRRRLQAQAPPQAAVEKKRIGDATVSTQPLEHEPIPFTEEQIALIENVVQNAVQTIIPDVAHQAAEAAMALANKSNTNARTQQAAQTIEAECNCFERIGFSATPATQPNDASDGMFNPAVPANFIKGIQNGEFFDLSKLLPRNLHKVAIAPD